MTRPVAKLANGKPAWTRQVPRLRQSEIDARQGWSQSDVRQGRRPIEQRGWRWPWRRFK